MEATALTALATQAPYIAALVGIVLIFTRSIKETADANARAIANMAEANARSNAAVAEAHAAMQQLESEQWREFLVEQRTHTLAALNRISIELANHKAQPRNGTRNGRSMAE
jgi:hypothetical protein